MWEMDEAKTVGFLIGAASIAVGSLIGAAIILAIIAGSLHLIVNAESNIAAGAIGFGTAVLMNWLHRMCSAR